MNIRQLEVFRAIMRDGTITAAANSLGVSQPAVSKLLAYLEDQLGYPLFERIGGRLAPTTEAHILYGDADRVFRQMEALSSLARDVGASKIGLIRIGASLPLAYSVLPVALTAFRNHHPEVKIHLHTLPKREIAEALSLGDVDVGVTLSPILAPTVRVETLYSATIVAILPASDPLTAEATITPAALAGRSIISYGSHAEFGAALDDVFAAAGQVREVSIQIASSVGALPLVRQGLGIALVDGLALWSPVEGIVFRPFRPAISTPVSLTINEARPQSRFVAPFSECLRQAFADASQI
ncbi:DNA-binding transcriptional LysR family regulator [Rhizobium tibeticum]|uniref:LysR family transcriptional regulator n=1 Tax=Rhizobium tibeticum TaxID=501024 RepID=UPI00277E0D47|nr:LysR family transcriptional regulator [Rhizobium tibeticum]MDP9810864.1 DNA-binding transcriptional LysR family regulator [Rhizobium tibeticum]